MIAADQALREDLRIAAKCGGRNYSDAIKENLLKYVARLDDAELTRAQPGWAALWGQSTRIKNIRNRSASIVDRALVLLGVDSRIVKSLIDILNSLSSETKLKEGIIVRILDVRFYFSSILFSNKIYIFMLMFILDCKESFSASDSDYSMHAVVAGDAERIFARAQCV